MSAMFSAIIIVGALVFPAMIEGINLEAEKKKKKPPATNADTHASARSLRDSTNIIPTNHRVQS